MSAERDLAEAIHHEIISPESVGRAVDIWRQYPELDDRSRMWRVLARTSAAAIDAVLARRQSEAARTGPWDGGHHFQEEDGYPGSLVPRRKRGEPCSGPGMLATLLLGAMLLAAVMLHWAGP